MSLAPSVVMRIVHVTPDYWPSLGGEQVYARRLSEGLAARGHQVTVLTLRGREAAGWAPPRLPGLSNPPRVIRFTENGALPRLLQVSGARRLLGAVVSHDRMRMIESGSLSGRLFVELLRSSADVVTVLGWWASLLPLKVTMAKRLRKWRMVGIPMFHTEEPWSRESVYPSLLGRCDAIIANTGYEKRFVEERVSDRSRVLVGGAGIDPRDFAKRDGGRIRYRHGLRRHPVVGYVGRLLPSKGVTALIKAMRLVWQWNPEVRLVLAGPRAPMGTSAGREVEQALARLTDSERARVVLLGEFAEEDKASVFDSLDVFAMPSIGESFGIAYLEAWMCEKPVIGASVGSTPYVIRKGVDGLLVNPQDPRHIGEAVIALLKDPAERARLGRAGYTRTTSEFTWDRVVDRIEGLYKALGSPELAPVSVSTGRAPV